MTFLDKVSIAFHLAVLATVGVVSAWKGLSLKPFLLNLFALALIPALARASMKSDRASLRFLHDFHSLLFFLPIYEQVGYLNRIVFTFEWDGVLQRMDQALFGGQPAVLLSRWFPWEPLSEYMHFAYFSFYGLFPVLALTLAARPYRERYFERYLLALGSVFYACNFMFLFLPALGPGTLPGADFHRGGWVFTPLMELIYRLEIPGGFFPSSHVALTAVVMYYARFLRRGALVYWVLGGSLILSTVYCGYHYVVDVFGGLLVAAAGIALAEWRWRRGGDLDKVVHKC